MNKKSNLLFQSSLCIIVIIIALIAQDAIQHRFSGGQSKKAFINPTGMTIAARIKSPKDYTRSVVQSSSFAAYLRDLPLKPYGEPVLYFNGAEKANNNIYESVVNLPIGKKDLHQCADAIMRLRAEYLWRNGHPDKIHFNFTNGFRVDYSQWMQGKRVIVKGNKSYWSNSGTPSNSYQDFWRYLETIFTYAGTLSLEKELIAIAFDNLEIGDIFIQGGSPGHAVIVVDMAMHSKSNEKLFLLAQSYMPAQEIQILVNPNNRAQSPWYSANVKGKLKTPEWTFSKADLKRFSD